MAWEHDTALLASQHGLTRGVEQMTPSCSASALNHRGLMSVGCAMT